MARNRKDMAALLLLLLLGLTSGLDNGVGRTPVLGWNTWMTCAPGDALCGHDVCNEAEVRAAAQAMKANGMQALGFNYVNLDDCWAQTQRNDTDGRLMWDTQRFPSGLPALIDWLHEQGFRFGLYTSAGNETCSSGGRPGRVPGSRGHFELDAQTFADWKVDYVKLDWCGDIKKQLLQGKQAHQQFAAAMNASGRAMFLEVVAGYFFLGADIASVSNSWRFCEDHKDTWAKTSEEVACRVDQLKAATGGPGGWAFMDFLMTGGAGCPTGAHCPGMTDDEYRTEFSLWALTQSPLIVATDVTQLTPVMRQALLNEEILRIHQSTATPPGGHLADWLCDEPLKCRVWGRKLATDGSDWMVALVNMGSKSHDITVKWSKLGWADDDKAAVRDLWQHVPLPNASQAFTASVPSHGTVLVRVTRSSTS